MNKFTLRTTLLSLSTALLLGITGCSSGGGGSDDPVTKAVAQTYSGIGIDGILVGSTVCVDGNPTNNKCDEGEPFDKTDDKGLFEIPATTVTGPLLLVGGVDNSTGQAFTGSLKAPAGSSVVTPLTSAIQSLVEGGKSAEDAEANVKAAMGLTNVDVNLTSFDPYNEVSENAQAVLAKQTQLQVLVHSATVTVAGADDGTDVNSTMSSVFDAIVENFDGATSEVELDAEKVTAATKAAADEVYKENPQAKVAAKVVAQTSAENSVRDAENAEGAISDGTPAEAAGNLDAAISKVNTTAEAELRAAAEAAKVEADKLTSEKIALIEALQKAQQEKEAEIVAAKEAQEKAEADLAAAKAAAEADAEDRAKYEAFLAAQAEAEKAAKEKAEADLAAANAAVAAAKEEAAIAAEAAQREADANAAAAQAQAEADAAAARQAAADAAALAAADQEKTLAEAQAAVEQAQQDAAAAIETAQKNMYVEMARFHMNNAYNDANKTRMIANIYTAAEGNATTAENAASDAKDAVVLAELSDSNSSFALEQKEVAATQAAVAASALADAYKVKADAELAVAAQVALQVKIDRIVVIVADVNGTKNASQTLYDSGTTIRDAIAADMMAIGTIAGNPLYSDAQAKFADANASAGIALKAYNDASTSLGLINSAYSDASSALTAVNETAANAAKDAADAQKIKLEGFYATGTAQAAIIAGLLEEAKAIKDEVDNIPVVVDPTTQFTLPTGWYEYEYDSDVDGNGPGVKLYSSLFGEDMNFVNKREVYYIGSSGLVDRESDDVRYVLKDGSWILRDTQSASSFTLTDNDTILNVPVYNAEVKIVSSQDISGNTKSIEGIGDVTFSEGAKLTQFAFRNNSESYELDGVEYANNEAGNMDVIASLEKYIEKNDRSMIGDNWWVVGDEDGGVTIAEPFTGTLVEGSSGSLSQVSKPTNTSDGQTILVGTAGTAGTWEAKMLPGTSQLAIFFNITTEAYADESGQFVTMYQGADDATPVVYRGWANEVSEEFKPFHNPSLNAIGINDVMEALADLTPANQIQAFLSNKKLYPEQNNPDDPNKTEEWSFNADATVMTYSGVDKYGDYDGNGTVTYEGNSVTFTLSNGGVFTLELAISDNYVSVENTVNPISASKFYFTQGDAYGSSTPPPVTETFVASLELRGMSISNFSPEDEVREWWWEEYMLDENGDYVVDPNSGRPDNAEYNADFTITLNGVSNIKYLGTVAIADFNTEKGSSFVTDAEIHKFAYLRTTDQVSTWGEVAKDWSSGTGSEFTSLEGVIAANDGSSGKIYSNDGFTDGGLAFGADGKLIIVDANGGVLNANAGTYEIIIGNGTTDNFTRALVTKPTYQGYESKYNMAFVEEGGEILYGDFFEAGSGGVVHFFNEAAKTQFISYFDANKDAITDEIRFGEEFSAFTTEWNALVAVDASVLDGLSFYELSVDIDHQVSTPAVAMPRINTTDYSFQKSKAFNKRVFIDPSDPTYYIEEYNDYSVEGQLTRTKMEFIGGELDRKTVISYDLNYDGVNRAITELDRTVPVLRNWTFADGYVLRPIEMTLNEEYSYVTNTTFYRDGNISTTVDGSLENNMTLVDVSTGITVPYGTANDCIRINNVLTAELLTNKEQSTVFCRGIGKTEVATVGDRTTQLQSIEESDVPFEVSTVATYPQNVPADYGDGDLTGRTVYEVYFEKNDNGDIFRSISEIKVINATDVNITGIEGEEAGNTFAVTYVVDGNKITTSYQGECMGETYDFMIESEPYFMISHYYQLNSSNNCERVEGAGESMGDINYMFTSLEAAQAFYLY
ncbi:MAG: hypothetical protein U9O86_07825 [Campylobacterota bacterium]|nr:hypothetical protein [Campylobacterota bacterium]